MRYYWKRYDLVSAKAWDTVQYATGTVTSSYMANAYTAYITASELYNAVNVDTGQIYFSHTQSETTVGQYLSAGEKGVKTFGAATRENNDKYGIVTKRNRKLLVEEITADLYQISNVHWEYSRGDYIDEVTSSDATAYPQDGKQGDYWYVYDHADAPQLTVEYNGSIVVSRAATSDSASISYDGAQIASVQSGQTKTLNCAGKMMQSDVIIDGSTLNCAGKMMQSDVTVTVGG